MDATTILPSFCAALSSWLKFRLIVHSFVAVLSVLLSSRNRGRTGPLSLAGESVSL